MEQFEKFIVQNRDKIQNDLPHEGHFERFELKLKKSRKIKPARLIAYASSVAAILVLALLLIVPDKLISNPFTLSDVSSQYADVEFYYTSSINKQVRLLKTYKSEMGDENLSMQLLLDEIEEFDNLYDQLCKDLKATPNDERVINALLVYYQSKLEIINKILNELDNQRKIIDHHENNSI